ncbi:probable inactive ribonuclease-like protein 12 [Talpa occidentalis]|uniref:probable inactive ribonuclease-like protein 12 n=1 Tax=Talpa occidentalis TaxID=50954 RepID=UPI00188FB556|nr:probable inactive ribonuclease-like protein 12 [Talpa occidentalis]
MLPVRATVKIKGVRAKSVKDVLPVMILMVMIFLLLLFWENELNEDVVNSSLEHLHMDYPKEVLGRYCNAKILQRIIREPNNSCKKEHVFIHERPRKINSVCNSPKKVACQNLSTILCFQSEIKFKMTVCQLIEGTRYPACRYHISPIEAFILITCSNIGPVNFQGYVR